MVNVNKNIVPGKSAAYSAKTEPQAPARRPRNAALNSSKNANSVSASVSLANIRKLNCSRESVLRELRRWLSEGEAEDYLEAFEDETGAQVVRLASPEEAGLDGDFWAVKDGKEQLWYRTNGKWYTKDDMNSSACDADTADRALNSSKRRPARRKASKSARKSSPRNLNSSRLNSSRWDWDDWDDYAEQIPVSPQITEAVAQYAGYDGELEIEKVLQPTGDVGEYLERRGIKALIFVYDPTDREGYEEILGWTGSSINDDYTPFNLADIQDRAFDGGFGIDSAVDSSKALNCSAEDPVTITTESGNEVSMQDIKIVQNPDTNELAIFIPEDEEETIPDGFTVIGMVVPDMVDSVPAIEGGGVCPECGQDPCVCESAEGMDGEEAGEELDSSKKKTELTEDSVDSSLGGGDDRQDATSQVTVPKSFPDDTVHDLYRWVESELQNEGIDVDVYGVGRPSASTISFDFEVTGRDPAEVDAIIEDRVKEFIANGNNAIQYPEGDPRSDLNSGKKEKNLNCTVDNARVEQTEQGTWVVRADTDRFGKDAILYEHYSEEGANKYLDRLKAGGDAVANGYDGSTEDVNMRYKGYFITGNDKIRYVCVSPYGKYSPKSYATLDEAKAAVDEDIKTSNAKK